VIAARDDREERAARALLDAGARFVFVHGSRAGTPGSPAPVAREDSDLDVAAWWGSEAPAAWDVSVPSGVDLLVLDSAPLWLAGRVATHGRLLATADGGEPERVRWQVDALIRWEDERPGLLERYEELRRQLAAKAGG
jgi:uncharacterized protein